MCKLDAAITPRRDYGCNWLWHVYFFGLFIFIFPKHAVVNFKFLSKLRKAQVTLKNLQLGLTSCDLRTEVDSPLQQYPLWPPYRGVHIWTLVTKHGKYAGYIYISLNLTPSRDIISWVMPYPTPRQQAMGFVGSRCLITFMSMDCTKDSII